MVPVRARLRHGAPFLSLLRLLIQLMSAVQRSETTELLIVLSEAERQNLKTALIKEDADIITQMLVDIDVEEAKAEQESDHMQLSVRMRDFGCVIGCYL